MAMAMPETVWVVAWVDPYETNGIEAVCATEAAARRAVDAFIAKQPPYARPFVEYERNKWRETTGATVETGLHVTVEEWPVTGG